MPVNLLIEQLTCFFLLDVLCSVMYDPQGCTLIFSRFKCWAYVFVSNIFWAFRKMALGGGGGGGGGYGGFCGYFLWWGSLLNWKIYMGYS